MKKHIAQFFEFLEDKGEQKIPYKIKFLHSQNFKFTKEELNLKHNLHLSKTDIKELPQGLKVGGDLYLEGCKSLKELPQGLKVGSNLHLQGCTSLTKLPQGLEVRGGLYLEGCTSLKEMPKGLEVRYLKLNNCTSLEKLPQGLKVDENLHLEGCKSLKELPQGLKVGRSIFLMGTPIAEKYSKEEIRKMVEDGGGHVNGKIFARYT